MNKFKQNKWYKGIVHWFDEKSGEGMIKDLNTGVNFYVHYSAIQSNDEFKMLVEGRNVLFQLIVDYTFRQVTKVKYDKKVS